ncbi:E3 ubiquitin/ISG15 ligase TRIM25-like [Dendropsophus ebraccatus]|uniref:E3 ubiquitin/ISG15 ligase TRIM25-like n=1 Tax=Dendropsophus ebraccatus TaxID=150705 RepID=UPI003831FC45
MSFSDVMEELECSICLDTFRDPVTLRCGHSFCNRCIREVLKSQKTSKTYLCPTCRKRFKSRPSPRRNTTLCNIVKRLKFDKSEQPMDNIFCTHCVETPVPAAKSCLLCKTFLCDSHLLAHSKSPEHVLIPLSQNMKEMLERLTSEREATVKHIQSLLVHRQEVQNTADSYTKDTYVLFQELQRSLFSLEQRILNEILRQKKQVSLSVDNHIRQLEVRKDNLSMRIAGMEEICSPPELEPEIQGRGNGEGTSHECQISDGGFRVDPFVPILISETIQRDLHDIITNIKPLYVGTEAVDVSLDANTAGNNIVVSTDQKATYWSRVKRKLNKSPRRFQACNQVLSIERFPPGRYYWEVDTCDSRTWRIGVIYPSIDRRSPNARVGDNKESWCLCRYKDSYSVRHDNKKTTLSQKILALRLGVYVDSCVGALSFYELGDPIEELYTFSATFSEPLHVVLCLGGKGCLRIRETH